MDGHGVFLGELLGDFEIGDAEIGREKLAPILSLFTVSGDVRVFRAA